MSASQQQQQPNSSEHNLFIADGLLESFADNVGLETAGSAALDALLERVGAIVQLYSNNGMQIFWQPGDTECMEVIVANRLLAAVDCEAAIDDVETYEQAFAPLQENMAIWVSETKRAVFDASVEAAAAACSDKALAALIGALRVAVDMLRAQEAGGSFPVDTPDDRALWDIVQATKAAERASGWALLRLPLVLSKLGAEPEEVAEEQPPAPKERTAGATPSPMQLPPQASAPPPKAKPLPPAGPPPPLAQSAKKVSVAPEQESTAEVARVVAGAGTGSGEPARRPPSVSAGSVSLSSLIQRSQRS